MVKIRQIFGVFIVLLLGSGWMSVAWADDGWDYPIRGNPDFADVYSQLQNLVNIRGFHKVNHFCIVADQPKSPADAEVYWSTEGKLILWEPQDDIFALLFSRDYIDLKHDVVPSLNEITDKYVIIPWTQPEINQLLKSCREKGNHYEINKTEDHWVSILHYPYFSNIEIQLQTLVDARSDRRKNVFCVVGQKYDSYLAAYVYWSAEDRLILWTPDPRVPDEPHALLDSFSDVNLAAGLADNSDYNSKVEQMPAGFAKSVLTACSQMGVTFTIKKSN